jgi:TPR repeat protein
METSNSGDIQRLLRNAEKGDPIAQNSLGARLATGCGVVQDILGSLYWYFQAIRQGYVQAKWNAGCILVEGIDGFESYRELGMKLIEEAAEANDSSACLFIEQCYRNGTFGKTANDKLASYWESRAWDYKNMKEFDIRSDLIKEHSLGLTRPTIKQA